MLEGRGGGHFGERATGLGKAGIVEAVCEPQSKTSSARGATNFDLGDVGDT